MIAPALLDVILTWLLIGLVFTGIGAVIYGLAGQAIKGMRQLCLSFWLGWACMIVYLQLWHLLAPVDARAWIIPIFVSVLGWMRHARLAATVRSGMRRASVMLPIMALVVVWTANHALAPLTLYDAGLYHLSAIRWINTFPIIPGLGNLHGRLAFNNASFLYVASLNIGPWAGHGYYLANSLLIAALLVQMAGSCSRIVWRVGSRHAEPADYFSVVMAMPAVLFVVETGISSTSTDIVVYLLQVVIAVELLRMLASSRVNAKVDAFALGTITFLALTGVLVKLSFAAVAVSTIAIATMLFVVRHREEAGPLLKASAILIGLPFITVVPWMMRGVILSGYAAYPNRVLTFPVPWKVPEAYARAESASIIGWARDPSPHYLTAIGNWNWIGPWYLATRRDFVPPLLVALVVLVAVLLLARRARSVDYRLWLVLVPASIGIIAWFVSAPDPRFASALFWIMAAGAMILIVPYVKRSTVMLSLCLVASVAVMQKPMAFGAAIHLVRPGSHAGFYALPTTPLKVFTTVSGLKVYTPKRGDQVWDAPLPATPYPNTHLRLRCAHTLRCGFVLAH